MQQVQYFHRQKSNHRRNSCLICDAILVALLIAFPNLALFLPGMMR